MTKLPIWARLAAFALALALGSAPADAQRGPEQRRSEPAEIGAAISPLVSDHSITVGGKLLTYRAEAATLPLRDAKGDVTAHVFYVADTLAPADPARPITFVFNGGPGAASAYLQLGAMGPRAMATGEAGEILAAPQRLIDNPDTWLDLTDMVFVDPVGTGYSRTIDPGRQNEFWGVKADAEAMTAFIRSYLDTHDRRSSPLFLVGESYGGFRAALLARKLPADAGLPVAGVVLVSPALELSLVFNPDPYNPLVWALGLPSLAAVRIEAEGVHDRASIAAGLKEVESYALGDYLLSLVDDVTAGAALAGARVAALTGLPLEVVMRQNGRVTVGTFLREFARPSGKVLSRYDGAVAVPDPGNPRAGDPVLGSATTALASAFVAYAEGELGVRTDIRYQLLNGQVAGRWDYGTTPSRQGFAGVIDDLQEARKANPALQTMIAHGYTDLVTPYFATTYLVRRLPPIAGAGAIDVQGYAGGHMMYLRPQSRRELKADAARLYQRALAAKERPSPLAP